MAEDTDKIVEQIRKMVLQERPNTIFTEVDRETGRAKQETFADFGQAWIEKLVRQCLPSAKLYPPMYASAIYGEFLHEFDQWRAAHNLSEMRSFQTVLTESGDLRTSCLRLVKRDTMTNWYGKQYEGNIVGFLCIDRRLIDQIARSFFHIVASGSPAEDAFNDWLGESFPHRTMRVSLGDEQRSQIESARVAFRQGANALRFIFGASPATSLLDRFMTSGCSGLTPEDERWMWSYPESVAIHFILGHEFGHYAYKLDASSFTQGMKTFSERLAVQCGIEDESLLEEIFCDAVGMENLSFQMHVFEVPPTFTVCASAWALLLIDCLASKYGLNQGSRLQALVKYWQLRRMPKGSPELAACAAYSLDAFRGAIETVAEQLIAAYENYEPNDSSQ